MISKVSRLLQQRREFFRGSPYAQNMSRRSWAVFVLVLVSGCTVFIQELKPTVEDEEVHATAVQRYGRFIVIHSQSYLPGKEKPLRMRRRFQLKTAQMKVLIRVPDGAYYEKNFLQGYAKRLSLVNSALEAATGLSSPVRELEINLIPAGAYFESGSASLYGRKVIFSLRSLEDSEETMSDSLRTVTHELFHVSAAVGRGISPGYGNELAAVTAESCVEFLILGRTAGAMPGHADRTIGNERVLSYMSTRQNSLSARYGADSLLHKLFDQGPIDKNDFRARDLLSLCKARTERLTPSH